MQTIFLRNYETFNEIPEGNVVVNINSNLMYVRIGRSAYIAREFIDSVSYENEKMFYTVSYHNIKNSEKVLILNIQKNMIDGEIEISNKRKDINIIPLINILNIKENDQTILSLNDIDNIVDFKEEMIPGKKNSII